MAHGVSALRPLKLQQTLHGYSDGHRLLGSSISLVGRDAKTMLMMSDASGPAAVIGDDGYLTGYPLPEIWLLRLRAHMAGTGNAAAGLRLDAHDTR